jgi:hypothetical protein
MSVSPRDVPWAFLYETPEWSDAARCVLARSRNRCEWYDIETRCPERASAVHHRYKAWLLWRMYPNPSTFIARATAADQLLALCAHHHGVMGMLSSRSCGP